jgi:L-rhamnose mutarotase
MKKYLCVIKIKPEYRQQYIDAHVNISKAFLAECRKAGYTNEVIYMFENLAIVYLECPDDKSHEERNKELRSTEICKQWDITTGPWLDSGGIMCEKIFDLNQQLDDVLKQD